MSLSVCIIAGNEEGNIGRCLDSVAGVADEVVLVDTGATDSTFQIAEGVCRRSDLDYQIIRDRWDDDFARSRNVSIDAARCDWLMWVDADEEIPAEALVDSEARDGLLTLKNDPAECAFQFITRNVGQCDYSIVEVERFYRMRMWPREACAHYTGRVHEQINSAIENCGLEIYNIPIEIHHHGYTSQDRLIQHAMRNARIFMQVCYGIDFGFPFLEVREGDHYAIAGGGRLSSWRGVKLLAEELVPRFGDHSDLVAYVNARLRYAIENSDWLAICGPQSGNFQNNGYGLDDMLERAGLVKSRPALTDRVNRLENILAA
jgi:glycosyltransferase involved in cell wall biosynthesis